MNTFGSQVVGVVREAALQYRRLRGNHLMCADGTYYAEIAVDVARALLEHNGKKGKGKRLRS
jgi:hypothetical protein